MSNDVGTPMNGQNSSSNKQLEALHVTGVTTVTVGTVVWAIAAVVLFLAKGQLSADSQDWPWIALAGTILGLMGIRYTKRRAARVAKAKS